MARTAEHNAKIAAALTGRKLSPEHAEKARRASLGRVQTPDEIERRAAANAGRLRSEEQRRHMVAGQTLERLAGRSKTVMQKAAERIAALPLDGRLKTCTCCGVAKDTSQFSKRKRSADGIHVYCRACNNAASREYKARNKNKFGVNYAEI